MTLLRRVLRSSIGRKQLVALTGIALMGFLVVHLAGNLLLFAGREAFDDYAAFLESNPLLIPAEIVLLALFLVHIGLALQVNYENRRARATRYVVQKTRGAKNPANTTMVFSGLIVLIFMVLHLLNFKFADRVPVTTETGETIESLYWVVINFFQASFFYVVWYILAVCVLGLHVSHGFRSVFRTLGLEHPGYMGALRWCGIGFGVIVAVGYSVLPIYAYFQELPQ